MNDQRRPKRIAAAASLDVGLVAIVVIGVAIGVGRLSASPSQSPSASTVDLANAVGSPSASASPGPSQIAGPTATPPATPAPPTWSESVSVTSLCDSFELVAAIGESGTDHLAAACTSNEIRYAASTDGRTWTTTTFPAPADRIELDPQLAFVGKTLYLAYTRDRQDDGGCGDTA